MSKLTEDSIKWLESLKKGEKVIVVTKGQRYFAKFISCQINNEDDGTCTVDAEYAKVEEHDFRNILPVF